MKTYELKFDPRAVNNCYPNLEIYADRGWGERSPRIITGKPRQQRSLARACHQLEYHAG